MTGRMNWRRVGLENRARDHGSVNVRDESERSERDRAARWLNRPRPQHKAPKTKKREWCGKNTVVIPGDGDPCPRCGRPMQIREHGSVGQKVTRQPFFYQRWFCCMHADCKTQMVMPERFKVENPVVWGDRWPDDVSNNVTESVTKFDKPADPNERPPWE
jgi:hypothetical protein